MKIEITADVVRVAESRQIGDKTKTELHLSYMDGDREQIIPIECWGQMSDKAKTLAKGDSVLCKCFLNGRQWRRESTDPWRAFMSLRCVSIDITSRAVDLNASGEVSLKAQIVEKAKQQNTEADDLPF